MKKIPKFKVSDHVRISKYKNNFAKRIYSILVWRSFLNGDLNGEEITGTFYEKELQETNKKEFRIEKITKRKGDNLLVKWKRYDDSFNSCINKKTLYKNESILS